ncbi:MAG: Uma2 family endonuclease [Verrucomicrobiae bacterium]|nr:Uma2 family endonuclease [Verrucomicrobiae bacterium]MCB1088060.1 Uma2 family endonuclease [Verrucomicrobiae bacterium]
MEAALADNLPISSEDYLRLEELAEEKHEYAHGRIYAMAGASDDHELVATNLLAALHQHLRGKGCRVYKSDMKLRLALHQSDLFYYPDVMVVCDPGDDHPTFKTKPKVLAEVMSDFKKDRMEKLFGYQQIPSLEEYLVIDPNPEAPRAWIHRRSNGWNPEDIGSADTIALRSLDFEAPLASLFEA